MRLRSIRILVASQATLCAGVFLAAFGVGLVSQAAQPDVQILHETRWAAPSGVYVYDVKVSGNYAYVAGNRGLDVIDVNDPGNFVRVGGYPTNSNGSGALDVSGNYVYLAPAVGLHIVDVSNPTNCVRAGRYLQGTRSFPGVVVRGTLAYLAAGSAGLQVVDVSNPALPTLVGANPFAFTYGLAVSGNYAGVIDGFRMYVVDVSNPTNPVPRDSYDTSGRPFRVAIAGNLAFVAGDSGLDIIDFTDPANCVRVGGWKTPWYAWGVEVSGSFVYLADLTKGLHVFDISNPTNCIHVASRSGGFFEPLGTFAGGMAVTPDRIYLVGGTQGLWMLPTLPNFHVTLRVDAQPEVPFTIEAAPDLGATMPWSPLLTTNVATMPFNFVDFDVKTADKPQKFYRVRQP